MARVRTHKWKTKAFKKDIYWLGFGHDGRNYFLEQATWDCGWYWGGGYIATYTNNNNPAKARDIESHNHFDCMFLNNPNQNGYYSFKKFFLYTPFDDDEIWKILELMNSFYIARRYAEVLYTGSSHYTRNPVSAIIKNDAEYNRINNEVIPAIMKALYEILEKEKDKDDEHD